jgi:homogentisate 1,2-dioxygenase
VKALAIEYVGMFFVGQFGIFTVIGYYLGTFGIFSPFWYVAPINIWQPWFHSVPANYVIFLDTLDTLLD